MADSPFVFEVTEQNFEQLVVETSHRVPVLVDFWAEWCGPCQMQLPVLLKLADEQQGKFLLAKVNTDVERGLATRFGIRSIPTMKLFRDGKVAEDILGAQTESVLRTLLDRYIERASDRVREEALQAERAGQPEQALALLRSARVEDPENPRLKLELARIAIGQGLFDEARQNLDALPPEARAEQDARRLMALLEIARSTAGDTTLSDLERRIAANPDDLDARLQLGGGYALEENYPAAMDQYLEILRRDRTFKNEAGRSGMLAVFDLLGNSGELVSRYRKLMFNVLH
jgi:putative thioredoxin